MPGGDGSNPAEPGSGNDRMIIVVQLIVGALLVMFAALLVIFKATVPRPPRPVRRCVLAVYQRRRQARILHASGKRPWWPQ